MTSRSESGSSAAAGSSSTRTSGFLSNARAASQHLREHVVGCSHMGGPARITQTDSTIEPGCHDHTERRIGECDEKQPQVERRDHGTGDNCEEGLQYETVKVARHEIGQCLRILIHACLHVARAKGIRILGGKGNRLSQQVLLQFTDGPRGEDDGGIAG